MKGSDDVTGGVPGKTCPTKEEVQAAKDAGEPLGKQRIFCWYTLDYSKFSKNNAAQNLTYGVAQIQRLTRANTKEVTGAGLMKTAMGFLFSFIFELIYLVAFFALFLAMVFRVAMLWLFIAFSPFLVLLLYLKELKEFGGSENDIFSIKALISWAFVPAKVGAVLTIGFIMISAGQSMTDSFMAKMEKVSIGTVLEFDTIFHGMDNVQEFIWLIMTTLIIWMGVFAVLKKLKGVEGVFSGIQNYLQRAGTFAAKAGYYAPIFPVGEGGEKTSLAKTIGMLDIEKQAKGWLTTFQKPSVATKLSQGFDIIKNKEAVANEIDEHLEGGRFGKAVALLTSSSGGNINNETLKKAMESGELKPFLDKLGKQFGKDWGKHTTKIENAIKGLKTKPGTPGEKAKELAAAPTAAPAMTVKMASDIHLTDLIKKQNVTEGDVTEVLREVKTKPDINADQAVKNVVESLRKSEKIKPATGGPETTGSLETDTAPRDDD